MGLLDDLKKEAEARKAAEAARAHAEQTRTDGVLAAGLPALFRIRNYLSELISQLRVLETTIPVVLPVPGIGPVSGFRQEGYALAAECNPPVLVTLRCSLRLERRAQYEMRAASGAPLAAWCDQLRRQGLQVQMLRMLEGSGERAAVVLDGALPALLQFRLDLAAGAIEFLARNFDELGERRQLVRPEDVTERWLNELMKYVLRQDHRFLVQELAPELREYFRRRLEQEQRRERGRDAPDIRASVATRLKSVFRRPRQLVLHYRGQSHDLGRLDGDFLIGRSDACDLVVRDPHASRFHARIELRGEDFVLIDESRNGTNVRYADGREIKLRDGALALQGGGMIALGTPALEQNPHAIRFSA